MAKFDVSKIEGYSEMSAEEKVKALEEFEYDDGSSQIAKLKEAESNACRDAAEWKRKHNALLSEEEKKKQAEDEHTKELEERLKEYEKKDALSNLVTKYVSLGYDLELATATAQARLDGDSDKEFENHKKFADTRIAEAQKELMKGTPRPQTGSGEKVITKEQFEKMDYSERNKLFNENRELYNKLNE